MSLELRPCDFQTAAPGLEGGRGMTDKYIKLSQALEAVCFNCSERNICMGSCDDTDRIKDIPAADFRPVVRGKWETVAVNDDRLPYPALIRCSECGHFDVWAFSFCPNCGADMREES